jgi:hypothetical protein
MSTDKEKERLEGGYGSEGRGPGNWVIGRRGKENASIHQED